MNHNLNFNKILSIFLILGIGITTSFAYAQIDVNDIEFLQTGTINTTENEFSISNDIAVREFFNGNIIRVSGQTIEGFPYITYSEMINEKIYLSIDFEDFSKSIELYPEFSESYAIRGVLRGILIKMKPFSVFTQGRKVGKDRDKALSLDKDNPRVHYLTGVSF